MIIRGNPQELEVNRTGQLAPTQQTRLKAFKAFRLPALPSALFGILLIAFSFTQATWISWLMLGAGVALMASAWQRQRSQKTLSRGTVLSFIGLLERVQPVPMAMFEAELRVDGKNYVLLSKIGTTPLQVGSRYRFFVAQGIARMGVIVGMEEA